MDARGRAVRAKQFKYGELGDFPMTGLQKHVIFLVAVMLTMCLCASAMAGGAGEAWLLRLASEADPMGEDEVPAELETLVSRRNDNSGNNTNDGLYMASSNDVQLVKEAAQALKAMVNAAEESGYVIYVRQGYRSYADEERFYDRMKGRGTTSYKPGESDYQTGLAVTLVNKAWRAKTLDADFGTTEEAQWLASNCSRYGFILRYPEGKQDVTGWPWEPWHFRYVGKAAAETICLNHLTLEEYCAGAGPMLPASAIDDDESSEAQDEPDEAVDESDEPDTLNVQLEETAAPETTNEQCETVPGQQELGGAIETWLLRLANANSPMDSNEVPEGLEKLISRRNDDQGKNSNGGLYMASSNDVQLVGEAAEALREMLVAAEDSGYVIYVRQGYRSYEDEARVYERMKARGEVSSKPGESDYQTGLAVTLVTKEWRAKALTAEFGATEEAQWLASNCSRYGFILRYPEGKQAQTGYAWEPWHFRYVGADAAAVIRLNHLSLEEFCAGLSIGEGSAAESDAEGESIALEDIPFDLPMVLPEGPIILEETDEDGDPEIILFHD